MDTCEAVEFLRAHQPMPPDTELTEELITAWDAATNALAASTNPAVPSLILNSFGQGNGFGVYQIVDDVLRSLPRERVIAALRESLGSSVRSVRSWSMEMAMDFVDVSLIPPALQILDGPDEDAAVFAACFLMLFDSHDSSTFDRLRQAVEGSEDPERRKAFAEVREDFETWAVVRQQRERRDDPQSGTT
jgi:HEAT repeat protein